MDGRLDPHAMALALLTQSSRAKNEMQQEAQGLNFLPDFLPDETKIQVDLWLSNVAEVNILLQIA